MKTATTLLLFFFLFNTSKAQTYFPGAADVPADMTQPLSPDAKAIYHAVDIVVDSIWFKMEFYTRIDNRSWNVKIGLDTNNNIADGGTWAGLNQSMKYDLLVDIYSNPTFSPLFFNLLDGNGMYVSSNINVSIPDTNILIIGLRLSEVLQTGTIINYIAGTGLVVGLVNDDIPDSNYITINTGSLDVTGTGIKNEFLFYPNPAKNILFFSFNKNLSGDSLQFEILDKQGKVCKSDRLNSTTHSVNIESLPAGVYFLNISDGKFSYIQTFIKQ